MARFFAYDYGENKHHIYAHPLKNEADVVVGYLPVVMRSPKQGGLSENISLKLADLRFKCFSEERLAREYAVEYFSRLESEEDIKRGYLKKGDWKYELL